VREQIRRALVDELKTACAETHGAVEALQAVKRAANARVAFWTLGVTASSMAIALFIAWWVLPTPADLAGLRTERDELASNVAVLNQRGGAGRGVCACGWTSKGPDMAKVPTTWSSRGIKLDAILYRYRKSAKTRST